MTQNIEDRLAGSAAGHDGAVFYGDIQGRVSRLQCAIEFVAEAGMALACSNKVTVDQMGAMLGIFAEEGTRICTDIDELKGSQT